MPAMLLTDLRKMSSAQLIAVLSDKVYEDRDSDTLETIRRIVDELHDRFNIRVATAQTQSSEMPQSTAIAAMSDGNADPKF